MADGKDLPDQPRWWPIPRRSRPPGTGQPRAPTPVARLWPAAAPAPGIPGRSGCLACRAHQRPAQ